MTLHNETDAIKQAVEAGYVDNCEYDDLVFIEPRFWQALGKARADNSNIIGGWIAGKWTWIKIDGKEWWLHHALRYFETLLSKGDLKKFWEELP